jgi:hypothetical protein
MQTELSETELALQAEATARRAARRKRATLPALISQADLTEISPAPGDDLAEMISKRISRAMAYALILEGHGWPLDAAASAAAIACELWVSDAERLRDRLGLGPEA